MDPKVTPQAVVQPVVAQPVAVVEPIVKVHKPGTCSVCGKPLAPSSGDIGGTCLKHSGKLRSTARVEDKVPDGYLRMSKVCRALEAQGLSTHTIVKACGGDACTEPVLAPVFQPVYVGGGKWLHPDVLTRGLELLKGATLVSKAKETVAKADATASATANALKNQVVKK